MTTLVVSSLSEAAREYLELARAARKALAEARSPRARKVAHVVYLQATKELFLVLEIERVVTGE